MQSIFLQNLDMFTTPTQTKTCKNPYFYICTNLQICLQLIASIKTSRALDNIFLTSSLDGFLMGRVNLVFVLVSVLLIS